MKKILIRALLLILTLTLIIVPLSACADKSDDETAATTTATNAEPDKELEMKIYLLNGTTALGASKLIVDAKAGTTARIIIKATMPDKNLFITFFTPFLFFYNFLTYSLYNTNFKSSIQIYSYTYYNQIIFL